jgi:hypothetical protein
VTLWYEVQHPMNTQNTLTVLLSQFVVWLIQRSDTGELWVYSIPTILGSFAKGVVTDMVGI